MLDLKHKNIAATGSMIKMVGNVFGSRSGEIETKLANLFAIESKDCDFREPTKPICTFNGSTESNLICCAGECPMVPILDEELKATPMDELDKMIPDE